MNSTLKSLLFWMVLVVIGILIWEFSTNFQRNDTVVNLTEFLDKVDHNEINHVTFTGNEISGKSTVVDNTGFKVSIKRTIRVR